jgi:2-polyprenyl-3-methyl-5-hydroxy-6-metoxy-1,4-benzoquinol methylase
MDDNVLIQQITKFHNEILERDPDKTALNHYLKSIHEHNFTLQDIKNQLLDSDEHDMVNPYYRIIDGIPSQFASGFFDKHKEFLQTSTTGAFINRLNCKYKAIIEYSQSFFKNSSVLDLASHDGRWTLAALSVGASHVTGIEGRKFLIENAIQNMILNNIPNQKFHFHLGDIHAIIPQLTPNQFDVIMCLGFFYHTMNHEYLISEFKRLNPQIVIFDTLISRHPNAVIELTTENSTNEAAGIKPSLISDKHIVVGKPSKLAIEMLLDQYGFTFEYVDWHKLGIQNWKYIGDYYKQNRITLVAKNKKII